jgi:hypothetical protein
MPAARDATATPPLPAGDGRRFRRGETMSLRPSSCFALTATVSALVAGALLLSACATGPGTLSPGASAIAGEAASVGLAAAQAASGTATNPAPATAPAAAAAAAAAAAVVTQGQPKPFADVIKDAKEMAGLFRVWQKDEKTWLEIAPEQFDVPYFFSVNLSSGIGENGFFGGLMDESHLVAFHKVGTQVQLIALNTRYFAQPKTPQAAAVREAFSDSLLSSAAIVSQPHPERKSVLIEATTLLLADIPGANGELERIYRQSYSFDARNSSITGARSTPELTSFNVNAHYALHRVGQPPMTPGSTPFTRPPATVPDIRSLFIGWYYNFAKLPETPMTPRVADDRVGFFGTWRFDYTSDNALSPRVNYIERWRLEKKDPAASLSEPKQPIVFWLDRNIPDKYRATIIDGVLEWNKAFERIGFKDAVQAKDQPSDADWETVDARHASIRWMVTARPRFGGIGPRQVDPRTGEILDADIGIDPVRLRNRRIQRVELVPQPITPFGARAATICQEADFAAVELGFALDLLEARGDIEADSPEAERFVLDDLKDVVMHEVGHALGLRHNFRASTVYTQAQLNNQEFTRANGIAGSVMEYNAINIALPGEPQGSYLMRTLGPYDYWAIEYGYKEIAAGEEAVELKRIAARSTEPLLAFSTDEDASAAIDPDASLGDLGSDPLAFVARRVTLARELLVRWQDRQLKPGEDYSILRRNVGRGLSQVGVSSLIAARYVGGVTVVRDHAGSPRPPLYPISPQRQRDALNLLATGVFAFDSFRFKPEFMQRLTQDYLDRDDAFDVGLSVSGIDYSLPTQVLAIQRSVLNQLMSEAVAQRILDSQAKLPRSDQAFRLLELYGGLHRAIFSELKTGHDIDLFRRNLQREYVNKVATALVRPSGSMPADARSQLRAEARLLRGEVAAAQTKSGYSPEARAHLAETLSTLDEALKAPLHRQGV